MDNGVKIDIRMYRPKELGDCFLLRFTVGEDSSTVLIDCGSFRNSDQSIKRLKEIAQNIKSYLGGKPIDVVVGTHQHNDHVSGFVHCHEIFTETKVDQVWLSWLDNPKEHDAITLKQEEKKLVGTLQRIHANLIKIPNLDATTSKLDEILNLYGVNNDPEVPSKGIAFLKKLGRKPVTYLAPGKVLPLPGIPEGLVNVFVLGPPKDIDFLYRIRPRKDETYDPHINSLNQSAEKFLEGLTSYCQTDSHDDSADYPFNKKYKLAALPTGLQISDLYLNSKNAYRKIKESWSHDAERLAYYLHNFTNNTSLVLAFQLVKSGKVLLFPADAQTGNWLSWDSIKWGGDSATTTRDLLRNTVVYKVGHHGSHNSTLVSAFELMNHPELVALIPVDRNDPNITKPVHPWRMPASNLLHRLKVKTKYRVLSMDKGFETGCELDSPLTKASWQELFLPNVNDLYIEISIKE